MLSQRLVSWVISFTLSLVLANLHFPSEISAHPGNTDSAGCHTCQTNCAKWGLSNGQYHCHNSAPSGDTTTNPVPIANTPPRIVSMKITPSPAVVNGLTLFMGIGTDDETPNNLRYLWSFGDGATDMKYATFHQYTQEGLFHVCLTITDPHGTQTQSCQELTVLSSFSQNPSEKSLNQRSTYEDTASNLHHPQSSNETPQPRAMLSQSQNLIPPSIMDGLPSMVRSELIKLSAQKQQQFLEEYKRKAKSVGVAYTMWLIFGSHYAYLGDWGMQLFHWFTAGGFGIWWLIDGFRIPSMVQDYNRDLSIDILRNLKAISDN